jgi:DNA polymerase III sliding clamp (beta) subunit (PCNA family)
MMIELVAGAKSILKKGRAILISCEDASVGTVGRITITSFEDSTSSAWHGEAEIIRAGSIAVQCDSIDRFLRLSSKSDSTIQLETFDTDNAQSLRIISQRGAHEFDGLPEDIFKSIDPGRANVPLGDLAAVAEAIKIAKTAAASENDVVGPRICLSGVHIRPVDGKFHIVATDGKKLAWSAVESKVLGEADIPEDGITIPGKMSAAVCAMIAGEPACMRAVENMLIVENGGGTMSFPLLEVDYPDYPKLLTNGAKERIALPTKDLLTALERSSAAIGHEERHLTALLHRDEEGVHLSSVTSQESSNETVSSKGGEACEISFNVSFLKKAISNYSSPEVTVCFTDLNSPIFIVNDDQPDMLMLVMPLRGSANG